MKLIRKKNLKITFCFFSLMINNNLLDETDYSTEKRKIFLILLIYMCATYFIYAVFKIAINKSLYFCFSIHSRATAQR